MASGTNSSFKIAYLDHEVHYEIIKANDKKAGYIAIGSAITSYARNWTIRYAQMNYIKKGKGFCYADTDSLHMDYGIENVKGCEIDDKELGAWKCESEWDKAIFVRQKTYLEHVISENFEKVNPYYDIKCAGMPDNCKNLFIKSITQEYNLEELTEEEREFCKEKREITDFKIGLLIPSKLVSKRFIGGVVLSETTYKLR